MTSLETSQHVAPPSIALARMAALLAVSRKYPGKGLDWMHAGNEWASPFMPTPRKFCIGSAGREYYAVLDRISRGEQP